MVKCNHDCFHCQYVDCIAPEDDITLRDQGVSNAIERYAKDNLGLTAAQRAQRKYEKSEKGKAASKRYRTSEKGKSANRRAVSRYYEKNKEKNRQATRDYYAKHAEKIKERMREYRRRKSRREKKMTLEGAKRNIKCVTHQLNRPLTKAEKDAFTIAYNCIDERKQLYYFKAEIAEMGDATIDAKEVLKILDKYLSKRKEERKKAECKLKLEAN